MKLLRIGLSFAAMALAGVASQPSSAQSGLVRPIRAQAALKAPPRSAPARPPSSGKGQPNARGMEGLPPKWVENLREMPPAAQERFFENNQKFQSLPPARQEQIRRNLQLWNNLTPEQKERAREAARALEEMTPQQRQYVRNSLLPRWQALPPERKQVINRHLGMLRNMSPATQEAALNDPKFTDGLSPDELDMLRELNSLRNPPAQ